MKTFTTYAEKKAKQILNLLQGYTKGIRMTAILVILLMGVSNAWADITFSGGYIYFDNSIGINQTYIQLCARQSSWTGFSTLNKINNTKLHYVANPQGSGWGSILGWVVIGNSTQKSNENFDNWTSLGWCSNWNEYGFNSGSTYLIVPTSTSKSQSVNTSYLSGGYSALNYTQTIKTAVNGADANSKAAITVTSYNLTGNGAISSQKSASISTSTKSTTISAARTATTTLTVGTVATGYQFDGWYAAKTGGTALSTSTTYTYYPTAATTVYARFSAKKYTITYKDQGNVAFSGTHESGHPTTHTYGTATTLKTASKTGYTFEGWYKESACTNKVTSLGADAYTANITLFAKWTEKPKYTVTISSDGNGTVTPNTPQQVGEIPVNITATANDGYKFKNWTKTGNVTIANANNASTTITATGIGTVTANFETAKRIYLKPAGDNDWANGNPRYAVYVIDDETWHNMTKINDGDGNTGNDIYYCDIKPTYQRVIFCRMDPNNATNGWDGIRWTQTEDLTLPDNCNLFDIAKDASTENNVKATGTWVEYNAWHLAGDFNAWALCGQTFEEQGDGSFTFTQHLEASNTYEFKLVHNGEWYGNNGTMVRGTSTGWTMSTSEDNCEITADYTGDYTFTFDASTKKLTVRYPILITLGESKFGPYGIKYNGKSYLSHKDKDVIINVPYGATITFIEGEPYSDIYTGGIMQSAPTKVPQLDLNQPFPVWSDVKFDDNYVTNVDQIVYLGVPTNNCDWDKNASYANFTWRFDSNGSFPMTNSKDKAEFAFEEDGVKYYKFTIPAGCNKFQIQRKEARVDDSNNTNETWSHTCDHEYMVLNTSINCYMLDNGTFGKNTHTGHWCALPPSNGDYRILYVEQQVAHGTDADAWKTVIKTTYQHASDIIKKGDGATIVSLHIKYDKTKHPEVILQKFTNGEWVDVEGQAHMVLSPLTASADMAMLPGRRNAEGDANLRYGDGIEKIKDDAANGKEGRVWNFVVQQSGTSAYINFTDNAFAPYEGNYYIRTDNAVGGWICYNQPKNVMSHSLYSLEHSGYSHYFCKWVEIAAGTPNVKFVVANQYGAAISDTIVADDFTDKENGTLKADANVRWMWNEYTNIGSRAYIAGSTEPNFLVAKYAASSTKTFADKGEWVYEADLIDVQIDDKLTSIAATYATQVQELLEKSHADAGGLVMLASAGNARVSAYTVRIVYDFKINQTICYLIPTGNAVATSIDVLIERINQDEDGQATQVTAAITPANAEGLTVYGVITLTKDHITNPAKSEQDALTYWISFPFDVKIGDITGFGEVGKHWMIKYYDGAERAAKGWFLDTKTFWKFFLDTENVMKANRGYVLTLNKSLLNASNPVYDNTETLRLYFPSMNKITTEINSGYRQDTVHITEHWCNITTPADRTTKDSHWNMIGVPSFANQTITTDNETVKYFYDYNHQDDTYTTAKNAGAKTFKPMHAYMVQFAGVIDWKSEKLEEAQKQLAAKKNADAEEQYTLRLELQQNGTKADQTFVELHDDATTMFDMNVDLTKMFNTGANIYTLIGSDNQVAANVLPIANTVIPVGVQIAKAGEYTFAMPDGTDGVVVELIDYEYNTRTNLLFSEYTVNLPAGTNDTRFALSVKPDKTATSMENITTPSDGELRKFIIDGVLYMQKDGVLYDAQGKLVR